MVTFQVSASRIIDLNFDSGFSKDKEERKDNDIIYKI